MAPETARNVLAAAAALGTVLICGGCGGHASRGTWPLPNGDLEGTRSAAGSSITAHTVGRLRPVWRFRLTAAPSPSGLFASTPVADRDTVYVQDLQSNVFALDRVDRRRSAGRTATARSNDGPNGLAARRRPRLRRDRLRRVRALRRRPGEELWQPTPRRDRRAVRRTSRRVAVERPRLRRARSGYTPFGRGALYALDAATGAVRWKFATIEDPWPYPLEAGGGGAWYPVSIDPTRAASTAAPPTRRPGAAPRRARTAARTPAPSSYTDSLLVLDARSGRLLWHDQVTPHDVRDYDFKLTPILTTRCRTSGRVRRRQGRPGDRLGPPDAAAALDGRRAASPQRPRPAATAARHRLPRPARRRRDADGVRGRARSSFRSSTSAPGAARSATRSSSTLDRLERPGAGSSPSTRRRGTRLWERRLPSPVYGCATVVERRRLHRDLRRDGVRASPRATARSSGAARMRAGVNGCPAVAGDLLLVGAGVGPAAELVAFTLR